MGKPRDKSFSVSKFGQLLVLASGVGALLFAFNNCGKVGSGVSQAELQADLASKVMALTQKYQGVLETGYCDNSVNYACVHKIFSPEIATETQGEASECIRLLQGGELCPLVQNFSYNSAVAQSKCNGSCTESYDYGEYDCHLKLEGSVPQKYPLVITEANITEAVQRLYDSCLQIQQGNTP